MIGEIIAVGEEVLAGDVVNSNAAFISTKIADIGVICRFHSVVGDVEEDILAQLELAKKRSEVVFLCGGLGPTKDDLTKEAVAVFLKRDLYEDEILRRGIDEWFTHRNKKPTPNNYKQALLINGSSPLVNTNGTAPGLYIHHENMHLFLLPGPPNELIPMLEEQVLPILKPLVNKVIKSEVFKLVNIGESEAVTIIDDLMISSPTFTLAPYAKLREVHLKVSAIGESEQLCMARIEPIKKELFKRLGPYIYSCDSRGLVEVVIDLLKAKGNTLSTAESCTGGLLASTFINVPGASSVFMEGVITYSNESKTKLLNVNKNTLDQFGAVSNEVAKEMAIGLKNNFNTDYALSITGVAGPDGGSEERPIGLVYIGVATPRGIRVYRERFMGNRQKIREQSAKCALIYLWDALKGYN